MYVQTTGTKKGSVHNYVPLERGFWCDGSSSETREELDFSVVHVKGACKHRNCLEVQQMNKISYQIIKQNESEREHNNP